MSTGTSSLRGLNLCALISHRLKLPSFKTPKPVSVPCELELHILASSVASYAEPPETINDDVDAERAMATHTPPHPTSSSHFICLLSGPLNQFILYSREEQSKWLIDIAHDLCDPLSKRGKLQIWAGEEWRSVAPTDLLTASVYQYSVPDGLVIPLLKISAGIGISITAATGRPSAMVKEVKDRDGRCWVTRAGYPLVNSHVCPKRMGDHLARVIFDTFVSAPRSPTLSIYDKMFCIALLPTLDHWFHNYELGLRFVSTVRNSSFLLFYN